MINNWNYPYSFQEAFYPVDSLYQKKFNVSCGRVNDVYGDRLLLNNK